MSFPKCAKLIRLVIDTSTKGEEVVDAEPVYPGLAVHPCPYGFGWNVTHIASGLGAGTRFKHRLAAKHYVKCIAPLCDWTEPKYVIEKLDDVKVAFMRKCQFACRTYTRGMPVLTLDGV